MGWGTTCNMCMCICTCPCPCPRPFPCMCMCMLHMCARNLGGARAVLTRTDRLSRRGLRKGRRGTSPSLEGFRIVPSSCSGKEHGRVAQPSRSGPMCGSDSGRLRTNIRLTEPLQHSSRTRSCALPSLLFHPEECSFAHRLHRRNIGYQRSTARAGPRLDDLPRRLCIHAGGGEALGVRCRVRGAAGTVMAHQRVEPRVCAGAAR